MSKPKYKSPGARIAAQIAGNRRRPSPFDQEKPKKSNYYTWKHNIEGCLRNGSYVVKREWKGEAPYFGQYMNGDYMGRIAAVPEGMIEVDPAVAKKFLPSCCS